MTRPCFQVDFNELVEPDLVLFSKDDHRNDRDGRLVSLREGLAVRVVESDVDGEGHPDELIADGVVERYASDDTWAAHVKWVCRLDANGIRHRSDGK